MKTTKSYIAIWITLVLVFNVIVFITPNEMGDYSKFGGAFWIGYIFIMLTFWGQLGVSYYVFKNNITGIFYRISIYSISYIMLIIMMIAGTACMVIPQMPIWLGVIICLAVLAFSIINMLQTQMAVMAVVDVDEKIKNKTLYVKSLLLDVDSLMKKTSSAEMKQELKKVYDAVRYSDPVSDTALAELETAITIKESELEEHVNSNDYEETKKCASDMLVLLNDRNKKCKLLK